MRHSQLDAIRPRLQAGLETARRLGATAAKLTFDQSEDTDAGFENARLKAVGTSQNLGLYVETVVDGRLGSASGNRPDELDEIIERAVALARLGSPAHFDAYPGPAEVADVPLWSERTLGLDREALVAAGRTICDRLKAVDPALFIEAGADRSETESLLVTSGGLEHVSRRTYWSLGGFVQRTEGEDILFAGEQRSGRDTGDLFDPDWIAAETERDLAWAAALADPPRGSVPVLLHPRLFSQFLSAVTLGVSGRNVAKGDSPLADRLGEAIFAPNLTLRDDPHEPFHPGGAEMDDDGVPTAPLDIVRDGRLEAFLYDLDTAGLAGARPTGHPGCHPWALEVPPGDTPWEDLLASIDDGLYLKFLIGFGQSNMMNGDVAGNVALGYRVKGGKVVGRVKNTMVAGNVYDLFKTGVRLSREREPLRRMPWALIDGVSVSAAGA